MDDLDKEVYELFDEWYEKPDSLKDLITALVKRHENKSYRKGYIEGRENG